MQPDTQIRDANPDDAAAVVFVEASSWVANYQAESQDINLEDIRSIDFNSKIGQWQHVLRSPNYKMWVAENDRQIVAYLAARLDADSAEIFDQHTLPDFARQGVGQKLFNQAQNWIGAKRPVFLRIPIYVNAGLSFYKKQGFSVHEAGAVDFIRLPSGKKISTIMMYRPSQDELKSPPIPSLDKKVQSKPVAKAAKPDLPKSPTLVSRSRLAELARLRSSTIKYYSEIGILPFEQMESRLIRRFELAKALARLKQITAWRAQGLSIADIKQKLG